MLKQIRTIVGCAVDLSFWDLMTTHEVFQYSVPHFFPFNGIACKIYIIQLASQALQSNKISEISCLCYIVSSMFMTVTCCFFFPIESLIAQYGLYSQKKSIKLLQSYLWENAEGGPKVRVWATEKFQFAIVILLKSSNERNILEKEIFWKKSNQMLTVLHPPSLFGTYETMWFCMCFLNQAGGEFPSGLCDS